jgi:hypothetical protein
MPSRFRLELLFGGTGLLGRSRRNQGGAGAAGVSQRAEDLQPERRPARSDRVGAEARARKLLIEHLNPLQRQQLKDYGWFEVIGGTTGRTYRIWAHRYIANIHAPKEGWKFCACCADLSLPTSDHVLAQKIMIESDERRFLRIANRNPVAPLLGWRISTR